MGKQQFKKPHNSLIILTGGAGFIGSCWLMKLNQLGYHHILVVDEDDSVVKMNNLTNKTYTDFIDKTDFIKEIKTGDYPEDVAAIFHIGACSSTMETDVDFLSDNNTEYSKILAQWALRDNILFYYASSAATYGDGSQGYSDDEVEIPGLKPLNLYGQSKQLFDLWLLENNLTDKIVGFKYFNVYGPNEYHKGEMKSLVVKAYQQIKNDGQIRLFKSYRPEYQAGEQKRDFVYIKDVIELMAKFFHQPQIKGIYNIGTGQARSWNDLAKAIFAALKLKPMIEYIEMPEQIKDKYQYFTQADISKLQKAGIKHQFMTLEEAVADYVQNYLEKGFATL
jgi:ADP-L-glycero-D-manno-heptose 6-epimerase